MGFYVPVGENALSLEGARNFPNIVTKLLIWQDWAVVSSFPSLQTAVQRQRSHQLAS